MPRRYNDYPDTMWLWKKVSSLGALFSFFSVILFIYILIESLIESRVLLWKASFKRIAGGLEWLYFRFPITYHSLGNGFIFIKKKPV
jgi:heme/copper-type cytochrome/quinol oxidase subunit 1